MREKKLYETVVLSDIHLGTSHSKAKEAANMLRSLRCKRLILNGDIVDGWHLIRNASGKWKKTHTEFLRVVQHMMSKEGTEVIYVRGNHDDFLDAFAATTIGNLKIVKEYVLTSGNRHYFVTHGDIFDTITTGIKWLAQLGDYGYTFLLWMNKHYNMLRKMQGKPYFSLSNSIKQKVKSAVSYISDFEQSLVEFARAKKCDGIICGHIHHAANTYYEEIHYLNSGDWVESMTLLAEDSEGKWEIIRYQEVAEKLEQQELIRMSNQLIPLGA